MFPSHLQGGLVQVRSCAHILLQTGDLITSENSETSKLLSWHSLPQTPIIFFSMDILASEPRKGHSDRHHIEWVLVGAGCEGTPARLVYLMAASTKDSAMSWFAVWVVQPFLFWKANTSLPFATLQEDFKLGSSPRLLHWAVSRTSILGQAIRHLKCGYWNRDMFWTSSILHSKDRTKKVKEPGIIILYWIHVKFKLFWMH